MNQIKSIIKQNYSINPTKVTLLREMIGAVYRVDAENESYIFKVYKKTQADLVKRSLFSIKRLQNTPLFIPHIYQTINNNHFIYFRDTEESIGVLYQYISGPLLEKDQFLKEIANELSLLHSEMDKIAHNHKYSLGYPHYVTRFLKLLTRKGVDSSIINVIKDIGDDLYHVFDSYPLSFCHGDFHNNNMIVSEDKTIYIIDFDTANYTNNFIDIATFCDKTNFNSFHEADFFKTREVIAQFMKDYDPLNMKDIPINDILQFIPIRHMELIATIAEVEGDAAITYEFIKEQYNWIRSFYDTLKKAIK